jgi:ankyrin repeat protein
VRFLIEAGSDVGDSQIGTLRSVDMIRLLLLYTGITAFEECKPLCRTAAEDLVDVVELLLYVFDPDALDAYEQTPLMLACYRGPSLRIVEILISHGSDAHKLYPIGCTLCKMHLCIIIRHTQLTIAASTSSCRGMEC